MSGKIKSNRLVGTRWKHFFISARHDRSLLTPGPCYIILHMTLHSWHGQRLTQKDDQNRGLRECNIMRRWYPVSEYINVIYILSPSKEALKVAYPPLYSLELEWQPPAHRIPECGWLHYPPHAVHWYSSTHRSRMFFIHLCIWLSINYWIIHPSIHPSIAPGLGSLERYLAGPPGICWPAVNPDASTGREAFRGNWETMFFDA